VAKPNYVIEAWVNYINSIPVAEQKKFEGEAYKSQAPPEVQANWDKLPLARRLASIPFEKFHPSLFVKILINYSKRADMHRSSEKLSSVFRWNDRAPDWLRKMEVPFGAAPSSEDGAAKAFLALTKAKRLAFVKKLADDIKDEKKSKSEAVTFVNELELYLYDQQKGGRILNEGVLRLIEKSRDYLLDRSASVKMILEFIAIIVP
jgi:hypothetical protein